MCLQFAISLEEQLLDVNNNIVRVVLTLTEAINISYIVQL